SYAEFVLRYVARATLGVDVASDDIEFKVQRNADFRVATVSAADGRSVSVAIMNGFRNIQSLMRKLKNGKCPYVYIEVMACPTGCVNGGGQARLAPGATITDLKARLAAVEEAYAAAG